MLLNFSLCLDPLPLKVTTLSTTNVDALSKVIVPALLSTKTLSTSVVTGISYTGVAAVDLPVFLYPLTIFVITVSAGIPVAVAAIPIERPSTLSSSNSVAEDPAVTVVFVVVNSKSVINGCLIITQLLESKVKPQSIVNGIVKDFLSIVLLTPDLV